MELIHLRILLALKRRGTLNAAAEELHLTQSALSHQMKNLEQRLKVVLWRKQGRTLVLTQAGRYLSEVAESVIATVTSAEQHLNLLAVGKTGQLTIGIDCHACYEWFRTILQPYLQAWPDLAIEVTSRYRFNAFEAIRQYKLDAVLTSDPLFNGGLHYQPLFDFELVLIVAKTHQFAGLGEIEPADLQQETILTYPVARERLDMFRKVLQPAGIEALAHVTVEETDIMLLLAASQRGVCLLPDWLLADQAKHPDVVSLRFKNLPLTKTMYLATRHEDVQLDYIQWLIGHAARTSATVRPVA
ncbi:LysR family transcriptional regulator [Methylovulum psychrotolerans]|uniref:LysR family transcriptional regulator n=1 Tax=Methylovulum psychrotolerans TaxID=1704499 RepID=A0A1Z4BXN8_9GAMM|nr:LysR family transcriptional regulator [Methylovulum psychrotolerans]ASF46048.1 LysR family transcriptional regulator [Methylovulum psychrotolerans]